MSDKNKEYCCHPNCKLFASKPHPNGGKLCDIHYSELLEVKKRFNNVIILTTTTTNE